MEQILLLPVFFPILAGIVLLFKKEFQNRNSLLLYVGIALALTGVLACMAIFGETDGVTLTCSCNAVLVSSSKLNLSLREVRRK